jgi:hypothetical protein
LNKKTAREKFFFTNLNYLQSASFEPLMHQIKDETEEGDIKFLKEIVLSKILLKFQINRPRRRS